MPVIPVLERQIKRILVAYWSGSLAYLESSRPIRDPLSMDKRYIYTHTHEHTYTLNER